MEGIKKKIMQVSKSMSGNEFVNFNADYSIALEYTGSPISNSMLLKVLPIDIDHIPTAKIAASPAIKYNLSLPVVQPVVRSNFRAKDEIRLGSRVDDSKNRANSLENRLNNEVSNGGFVVNGDLQDRVESSGTLGFSGSSRADSNEFSESSGMLEPPFGVNEIEELNSMHSGDLNDSNEPRSRSLNFGGVFCEEEEVSDGEQLEDRRKRKGVVTFRSHESSDANVVQEDSMFSDSGFTRERPVAKRPPKKGMCYHCHRGTQLTDKEACLVCDAKYCSHCIRKAMGSMPEGRKCLTCVGFPVEESKRKILGKSSRILRGWLTREEVKQIMESELFCAANQLPSKYISVNSQPLSLKELMILRSCPNPPRNLKPGSYWYDRVSGFWGKEGHKPCQIITPALNVGKQVMMENCSNGNTNVKINGREITKAERWVLESAGVMCEGGPAFWLGADGTYSEEGMDVMKGNIWGKKRTKIWCALLSLPTPESPNSRRRSNNANEGELSSYLLCKVLLVGNDSSGTSTIYKQARVLYNKPFLEEERQSIKAMIQSNLYEYLARLLEAREIFEEEILLKMKNSRSEDPGPSDSNDELVQITEYSIGKKLKVFSDWLINGMVSSNLDLLFPAATREYAPYVEELWKDPAIQATYSRRDELELPRVASYFLDRAIEIAKVDYEPSDTDIMYAEGITSSNGLTSMEFQFPHRENDDNRDPNDQPDPVTRYQLIRASAKSLGENCKWLQMFEDVEIVLFCVSLTDYDEYTVDSTGLLVNKMLKSKKLFENIVTHPTYKDMNFLLILNKFDLLEEKIEQVPLTRCEWFKDFNPVFSQNQSTRRSGNNIAPLAQRAFHYIGAQYKKLFRSLTGRNLYVCPVTALESDTVDNALRYAREILKWEAEHKSGYILNDISSESIENSSYS